MTATDPGRQRWRETTRAGALKGRGERRERFVTTSDIEIADLYTEADLATAGGINVARCLDECFQSFDGVPIRDYSNTRIRTSLGRRFDSFTSWLKQ